MRLRFAVTFAFRSGCRTFTLRLWLHTRLFAFCGLPVATVYALWITPRIWLVHALLLRVVTIAYTARSHTLRSHLRAVAAWFVTTRYTHTTIVGWFSSVICHCCCCGYTDYIALRCYRSSHRGLRLPLPRFAPLPLRLRWLYSPTVVYRLRLRLFWFSWICGYAFTLWFTFTVHVYTHVVRSHVCHHHYVTLAVWLRLVLLRLDHYPLLRLFTVPVTFTRYGCSAVPGSTGCCSCPTYRCAYAVARIPVTFTLRLYLLLPRLRTHATRIHTAYGSYRGSGCGSSVTAVLRWFTHYRLRICLVWLRFGCVPVAGCTHCVGLGSRLHTLFPTFPLQFCRLLPPCAYRTHARFCAFYCYVPYTFACRFCDHHRCYGSHLLLPCLVCGSRSWLLPLRSVPTRTVCYLCGYTTFTFVPCVVVCFAVHGSYPFAFWFICHFTLPTPLRLPILPCTFCVNTTVVVRYAVLVTHAVLFAALPGYVYLVHVCHAYTARTHALPFGSATPPFACGYPAFSCLYRYLPACLPPHWFTSGLPLDYHALPVHTTHTYTPVLDSTLPAHSRSAIRFLPRFYHLSPTWFWLPTVHAYCPWFCGWLFLVRLLPVLCLPLLHLRFYTVGCVPTFGYRLRFGSLYTVGSRLRSHLFTPHHAHMPRFTYTRCLPLPGYWFSPAVLQLLHWFTHTVLVTFAFAAPRAFCGYAASGSLRLRLRCYAVYRIRRLPVVATRSPFCQLILPPATSSTCRLHTPVLRFGSLVLVTPFLHVRSHARYTRSLTVYTAFIPVTAGSHTLPRYTRFFTPAVYSSAATRCVAGLLHLPYARFGYVHYGLYIATATRVVRARYHRTFLRFRLVTFTFVTVAGYRTRLRFVTPVTRWIATRYTVLHTRSSIHIPTVGSFAGCYIPFCGYYILVGSRSFYVAISRFCLRFGYTFHPFTYVYRCTVCTAHMRSGCGCCCLHTFPGSSRFLRFFTFLRFHTVAYLRLRTGYLRTHCLPRSTCHRSVAVTHRSVARALHAVYL